MISIRLAESGQLEATERIVRNQASYLSPRGFQGSSGRLHLARRTRLSRWLSLGAEALTHSRRSLETAAHVQGELQSARPGRRKRGDLVGGVLPLNAQQREQPRTTNLGLHADAQASAIV
jgi:hypothetical protein